MNNKKKIIGIAIVVIIVVGAGVFYPHTNNLIFKF